MGRNASSISVTFADSASLSSAFDMSGAAELQVIMPTAWTAARLGLHVSTAIGGTYVPLKKGSDDSVIEILSNDTSTAYTFPTDVAGSHFAKLWSHNSTGANVLQTAARTLTVVVKS